MASFCRGGRAAESKLAACCTEELERNATHQEKLYKGGRSWQGCASARQGCGKTRLKVCHSQQRGKKI